MFCNCFAKRVSKKPNGRAVRANESRGHEVHLAADNPSFGRGRTERF